MDLGVSRLTVMFEEPFWIGLYEREEGGRYSVCKITFGAEPKDYDVLDFLLKHWKALRFTPAVAAQSAAEKHVNPKRMQRQISGQLQNAGIGTKAQQALKLQQEQDKLVRKERSHAQREAEKQRRFELHQQKRKEKHRGH